MADVQLHSVSSDMVSGIGYDPDEQEIYVLFATDGSTWAYSPASPDMWQAFQDAGSKGQFVHRVLKRQCSGRRV